MIFKNFRPAAAAMLAVFALASCQKKDITEDASISIAPVVLEFAGKAASPQAVNIKSNVPWKASCPDSWVKVTPSEGESYLNVQVSVEDNDGEARSSKVTFSIDGKEAHLTVKQATSHKGPWGPEPGQVDKPFYTARWETSSSRASSGKSNWESGNKCFADLGDGASKAYISTFAGGSTTPKRTISDNSFAVSNLATGDGLEYTVPDIYLAEGSTVDFNVTMHASSTAVPKYWIFEFYDGEEWRTVDKDLHQATEDPSLKYSFYIKTFSSTNYTTFTQSFTLPNAIGGDLKMRCRVVGKYNGAGGTLAPTTSGYAYMIKMNYIGCVINAWQANPVKDVKKVLVLGNSFTYYYGAPFALKEIARSQGHQLDMRINLKGGQYFRQHSALELSQAAVKEGGYDFCVLQDQSGQHARYYADIISQAAVKTETKTLIDQIKQYSPGVTPILVNTWSFLGSSNYEGYGSFEVFDKALEGGAKLIADDLDLWMSPVCLAFKKARAAGVSLYHSDNKHPNRNGMYLQSCVNYLIMFGEKFDSKVTNSGVDANTAAKLRAIAEEIVLGHEAEYRNVDASGIKPGEGVTGGGGSGGGELDPDAVVPGENGIRTADQLQSFMYVYATGGDVSSYKNAAGEYALLADIDLDGATLTCVGGCGSLAYNSIPVLSNPFTGVFNGGGHTISNLKFFISDNATSLTGLFCSASGATIKDLRIDGVKLAINTSGIKSEGIAAGTIVGCGINTKIENVTVTGAEFSGKATSTASRNVAIGGIAGIICCNGSDFASSVTGCSFDGSITNDVGEKYSNSNTAVVSGIVAQVPNTSSTKLVLIKDCVNNAKIDVKVHKAAGIIGHGFYSHVENCTNNGDISCVYSKDYVANVKGVRMGGIMAYCSFTTTNTSYLKGCVNNGTISTTETGSACGGVVGLMRTYSIIDCVNNGNVYAPLTDASASTVCARGLLVGHITNATNPSTVTNCSLKGSIGTSASDAVPATAENYLNRGIGICIASDANCPSWNAENVHLL